MVHSLTFENEKEKNPMASQPTNLPTFLQSSCEDSTLYNFDAYTS